MHRRSPILEKLAELYAESTQGLTGQAARDYAVRCDRLLREANCESGDAYTNALSDLVAQDGTALVIEWHRRSHDIQKVRVPLACEPALFEAIGCTSPTVERAQWADLFETASSWPVPAKYAKSWKKFCQDRAGLATRGESWQPFRRHHRHRAHLQLATTARLLDWRHPALLRTVSAQICGNSKFLEKCIPTIEQLLVESSAQRVCTLSDLQISDNPRAVRFHGPIRIHLRGEWQNFENQTDAILSEKDLADVDAIECAAERCVTVENATKFHELGQLRCGDLFVFTSYPNRATLEFLRRLPSSLPRYHFGDTDPWGFDVLRSLRVGLGSADVTIAPLHMRFRPKPVADALNARDLRKLGGLLNDPILEDVRKELLRLREAGNKGDFEQESVLVTGLFPYVPEE